MKGASAYGQPVSLLQNGGATWHGSGATWTADFGDGTQITVSADAAGILPSHVYGSAGTFTVRLTLTDAWDRSASAQGTVIIKSLTGRWTVGTTGAVFTLTQSGGALSGTYTTAAGSGSGTVSGTIRAQQLVNNADNQNMTLTVTPTGAGAPTTFAGGTGFADNAADVVIGTLTSGSSSLIVQLLRQ